MKIRVGPKCSAILTTNGDMYAAGSNRGNRLLCKQSDAFFKKVVPPDTNRNAVDGFAVADVCFGPFHSVLLKKDGRILNIVQGSNANELKGITSSVVTIDTTCNREKCNFGVAMTKNGHVFKWKIGEDKASRVTPRNGSPTNIAVSKEFMLLTFNDIN